MLATDEVQQGKGTLTIGEQPTSHIEAYATSHHLPHSYNTDSDRVQRTAVTHTQLSHA
jgi:hypothetical protein